MRLQKDLKPAVSKLKFIYSEKATKFCEIFTLLLTGTTQDKSKVQISQTFVAFSEYMNFKRIDFRPLAKFDYFAR